MNGIVDIIIEPGYLASLHTLDLSYNSLSEGALLALGTLPLLRELHLTGQYALDHNIIIKLYTILHSSQLDWYNYHIISLHV